MKKHSCLLIIDMQNGSFVSSNPGGEKGEIVKRINSISEAFRGKSLPVIVVQHNGTALNEYIPFTKDWEFLEDLNVEPTDTILEKRANDAFYGTDLQARLAAMEVTDLVITGSATEFCVDSTIQSALVKDYNVLVVADGHATENKLHMNAKNIIIHYNWVWRNLIPTKGGIAVKDSGTVLGLVSKM